MKTTPKTMTGAVLALLAGLFCGQLVAGEVQETQTAGETAAAVLLLFDEEEPDTLVLVTADHSQAAQLIPYESLFSRYPIPIYNPGKVARIRTPEGSVMVVNYATNNFVMEEHTGANVPHNPVTQLFPDHAEELVHSRVDNRI